ncbi:MAG TPA: choice-of-anchor Q domain-containing protein [Luteimonas sp.]|nr:choice-of-anchor Q domain-containing protein [Luteimonas sp.]
MRYATLRHRLPVLSAACALALGLLALQPVQPASAAVRTVGNCNDAGAGSLRGAVAMAASGDLVDLAGLSCGRILLTSGAIEVPQDDLELVGPGATALLVDGNGEDRVFAHTGAGTLRLRKLSIARGRIATDEQAWGGCIFSTGNVALHGARLHRCVAENTSGIPGEQALGGGIYALGKVTLAYSRAFYNRAHDIGGAIMAIDLVLDHSVLYENWAWSAGAAYVQRTATVVHSQVRDNWGGRLGGGLLLNCPGPGVPCFLVSQNSTFSGNRAMREAAFFVQAVHRILIADSTISGNVAQQVSVAWLPRENVRIANSTIFANREEPEDGLDCAGALIDLGELDLDSSIVSGNTCSIGTGNDIYGAAQFGHVVGGHNIIGNADIPLPDDTIRGDPRLAPLADNGGITPTHRPLADSPALDRGSNPLDLAWDQRGVGFPRVQGAFAEIGAIER